MQISQRTQYGVGKFIVAILVGVLIFIFLAGPKFSQYRQKAKELKANTELETRLKAEDQEISRRLNTLETKEDQIDLLNSAIPSKASVPDLYAYLETLVKTSNLTLSTIQAVDASALAEESADKGNEQAVDEVMVSDGTILSPSTTLGVISVSLEVKGDINGYKQFLAAIENSLRIMDVQSVEISNDDTDLTYRIALKTYYQK